MRIRFAMEKDIPAILAMCEAVTAESRFHRYGINKEKLLVVITSMMSTQGKVCILLAERTDGNIAGLLAGYVTDFFFCDGIVAQDRLFYVRPDYRGSSAAVKLLIAFRRWAENHQANELSINMSVGIDMGRFNKLMTHMGFGCCGSNFSLALAGQHHQ
ncbi:hypothetical protein GALL_185120 [mine drainage metagenome]|uniref:N-acetyltransferase domain-containing protein n=1 Tax=mine drainage metagenome TaxID=410659 RepID=A0A1J5S5M4_9ZZZZ